MDIEDESFPDTGVISIDGDASKELQPVSGNSSSDDHNFSSPRTLQEGDSSVQSSSGSSNQGRKFNAPGDSEPKSTQPKFPHKAQSFQDLHSEYTKKRYQHVKSKVKQYIINIQNESRRKQTITRHKSLPEALSGCSAIPNPRGDNDCKECNHEEVVQLKTLNEYLHENLQEKMVQMARLKRNSDSMRIELMQLKEKDKQRKESSIFLHPGRHVLPIAPHDTREKRTTGTQTLESVAATSEQPSPVSQESQHAAQNKRLQFQLSRSRHRHQLQQDVPPSGNDLQLVDSESDEDEKVSKDRNAFTGGLKSKRRKKCRVFKGKNWKSMFSCSGVVPCCDRNSSLHDEYAYTQIPLNDTNFVEFKA